METVKSILAIIGGLAVFGGFVFVLAILSVKVIDSTKGSPGPDRGKENT